MSSPIVIQRASSEPTDAASSSTSASPNQRYVPVHKRQGGSNSPSPSSSRASSPAPSAAHSWRSASPLKAGKKFPTKAFPSRGTSPRTNIPASSSIPKASSLPFMYSIPQLLQLSSSPATLTPPQLESIEDLVSLCVGPNNNDTAAARRRRTGRRTKPSQQKVATKTVDVDVRRTRQGHGTWGWHAYSAPAAAKLHEHEMEAPWRHASMVAVAAA